jgi:hypothetical protein
MAKKGMTGLLHRKGEYAKHLRKAGKKEFWKSERQKVANPKEVE